MYAAAGGASLASRQARLRQKANKKVAAQKAGKATDIIQKPRTIGQFSNYTDESVPPRLSRVERNALKPPETHERRHSTSHYHLKEPKARIRESPSICIPVQQNHCNQRKDSHHQPLTPCTLVHNHLPLPAARSPSLTSHLPQILIPEDGDKTLERRCSFVRQVEEMEKFPEGGTGVLDRCHHMCNFEIKDKAWENNPLFCAEYDRSLFGSLDYPFSECSQGRAAWQERERGRRCSLSEEARQHRLKQSEAHHRWMKRNRIHDTTFGGSSEEEDFFDVYHQSAAANALLYVGLGTVAIGSVIFFVGTGEKGFKTLELRLIGPTLIACGLLCCLIRVLLCACPSNCLRRRKKTRLKSMCPHSSSSNRYPTIGRDRSSINNKRTEYGLTNEKNKKKVSIVPNIPNAIPSTSTSKEEHVELIQQQQQHQHQHQPQTVIPIITVPDQDDHINNELLHRDDSLIELENLDNGNFELQSVSSIESETVIEVELRKESKHARHREPIHLLDGAPPPAAAAAQSNAETSLCSRVDEKMNNDYNEPSASSSFIITKHLRKDEQLKEAAHSGIVLSPLQLGQ